MLSMNNCRANNLTLHETAPNTKLQMVWEFSESQLLDICGLALCHMPHATCKTVSESSHAVTVVTALVEENERGREVHTSVR